MSESATGGKLSEINSNIEQKLFLGWLRVWVV